MGKSYRPYHPDREFLLPASLHEWLPENHLVYFVSDVVDNLNLSALDAVFGDEQRGWRALRGGFERTVGARLCGSFWTLRESEVAEAIARIERGDRVS